MTTTARDNRARPGMLAPFRVLDLTDGRAELATHILAGLGADVVKVEPPGGSPSRWRPPLAPGEPEGLSSLHFHSFNRSKRSVAFDLDRADDREQFLALVANADFLFENGDPGSMEEIGLGFHALREVRPDLVYVSITPFGQTGPYAAHLSTDLTLSAMGGAMALNGDADRRPVRISVPQTWLHAAAESALGALVAHHRRLATGEAQYVDVSVQAAVFWTGLNAMSAHAIQGRDIERCGAALPLPTLTIPLVHPCADGEVCVLATKLTLPKIMTWMVEVGAVTQEWASQEDWNTYDGRVINGEPVAFPFEEVLGAVGRFTRSLTKTALFNGGLARGATLAPVHTTADVLAMEHLTAREFWLDSKLPSGRRILSPGAFVKTTGPGIDWPAPAPAIGEHTAEVLAELASADPRQGKHHRRSSGDRLPLEGVKVADFSWIGVGPITAKALADHGATVIRIETDNPPDRVRMAGPFKDGVPGINRCQFFGSFNTSKLSLQLDLKSLEGLGIAKELLRWCDVAIDSFTAGTMDRLGLGYDVARALNPSIIMATTCLLGQTGPASLLSGYGYHAAALSGFFEVTGWTDRAPSGPFNAYTDTVAPRFLATTLLAALDHRRRTGEGQYIDQAQMESALHFLAPELLDTQVSGRIPRRAGNHAAESAPHDAYPCAGEDEWCTIAVETDAQWQSLRLVLGDPDWAKDTALSTHDGRANAIDLIDREIGAFTRQHEARHLMDVLQAAGVPAGMVQRSSDLAEDPQLEHRRFFRPLLHPEMGLVPYEGHPYRIAGYDNGPRFPAPCLGEHTYVVLRDVLGLGESTVTDLLASGACG